MKLIINISDKDYKECKFRKDLLSLGGEPTELTFNMRIEKLVGNGIPLEDEFKKIREEIKKIRKSYYLILSDGQSGGYYERKAIDYESDVFEVIDNRIKELNGE